MLISLTSLFADDNYLASEGRWFVLAWAAVLGGILGSFMNVVVYRLPRHLSLSHPGSRCPSCGHPIRWHDNVPIIGWLKLRGRCRDCKAPISLRYPLVEATVAAVSALIAWAEGIPEIHQAAVDASGFELQFGLYAFHMLLVCTLICAALMEFDGHPIPASMWVSVLAVGLLVPLFRPDLRSIGSVLATPPGFGNVPSARALTDGVAGLSAAVAIGFFPWMMQFSMARRPTFPEPASAMAELLLIGAFLGNFAVLAIGLTSMTLYFVTRILARTWLMAASFGWAGPLTLVTLAWISSRAENLLLASRLVADHARIGAIVAGLIVAVLTIVLHFVPRPEHPANRS